MPVSEDGDTAHVASACDNACCKAVWIVLSRERWAGKGVWLCLLPLWAEEGGVGGLKQVDHEKSDAATKV
jgi:hypothetical protein